MKLTTLLDRVSQPR